jgi:hypothetical protein
MSMPSAVFRVSGGIRNMWKRPRSISVIGGIATLGPPAVKGLEWIEHVDFISEHMPWLKSAIGIFTKPTSILPTWAFFVIPVVGLLLIAWNLKRDRKSPLEIVFDTTNPHKRYWSRSPVQRFRDTFPDTYVDEYRIMITNKSKNTIRNVRVSKEVSGIISLMPQDMNFHKDGTQVRDLQPLAEEYVPIFWQYPPEAGDAWGKTATKLHGPINITVSGDDVIPARCAFEYHPDDLPAIKKI